MSESVSQGQRALLKMLVHLKTNLLNLYDVKAQPNFEPYDTLLVIFLATLVALHFTPVSERVAQLVGRSFKLA